MYSIRYLFLFVVLALPYAGSRAQSCDPAGAWEVYQLTFTDPDGTVREIDIGDPPGLKVLSQTHWAFVEQNEASNDIPTSGGGGSYTVHGNTYTEVVEYHAARSFIGQSISFDCRVEGDFWYQSGTLPDGTKLDEVYRRASSPGTQGDHIQPYSLNPRFWQYEGEPVMLLGGTKDDNLFQIPDLEAHLDLLASVGGNYIRNTMSARDEGNVQPFARTPDGRYDLDSWNEAYWDRFRRLLELTRERDVIVQIEIWAFHDFYGFWDENPWNPANNVNYTEEESGLQAEKYGSYWDTRHDFFLTAPGVENNEVVLAYQKRFVDRLLSESLAYNNVLYCMTNEIFTQYPPEWGWYWAGYIKEWAAGEGRPVRVAEMYQNHDLDHEQHRATLDHPEIYDFVDISQNSRKLDQEHWDKLQWARAYIADQPRPINHTKTYGGPRGEWTDGPEHGIERFWRNVVGGAASTRFHRPPSGIGLSEEAQAHIRSARMLVEAFDVFKATPDVDSDRLHERSPDEAYLSYVPGEQYAILFPAGGEVQLDLTEARGAFVARWLDIQNSRWSSPLDLEGGRRVDLKTPGAGGWVALVDRP